MLGSRGSESNCTSRPAPERHSAIPALLPALRQQENHLNSPTLTGKRQGQPIQVARRHGGYREVCGSRVQSEEPCEVGPRRPQRGARPRQDRHREGGKGHSWGLASWAEPGAVAGRPTSSNSAGSQMPGLRICGAPYRQWLSFGKKVAITCKGSKKTSERKKETQIKQRGEEIGDERGII